TALLMLEKIEAGFELPNLAIVEPIARIRDIARDTTGRTVLELASGGTITALEVQQALHARAVEWLTQRPDEGTPRTELERVVTLWGRVLDALESGDLSDVAQDVDWIIKLQLLERYRDRLGGDWGHPKLAQVDLTYHDIRPDRGLYSVLESRGLINRWTTDAAITRAVDTAPPTTRAWMRGQFLAKAKETGANYTVDWTRMKVNRPEARVEEFSDPFISADARLDALLEYMDVHARHLAE
ncbi:proteasome accessory factor PafA2 family protein, partial [Corynebacterium phoceense]|uniref:proteasome accessory factor PafA2 family protein n=1 Tax=Corynebacterium phoceense TaxID=1686286 RepID=UPI00211C33BA